jgi:hypothetical protein
MPSQPVYRGSRWPWPFCFCQVTAWMPFILPEFLLILFSWCSKISLLHRLDMVCLLYTFISRPASSTRTLAHYHHILDPPSPSCLSVLVSRHPIPKVACSLLTNLTNPLSPLPPPRRIPSAKLLTPTTYPPSPLLPTPAASAGSAATSVYAACHSCRGN